MNDDAVPEEVGGTPAERARGDRAGNPAMAKRRRRRQAMRRGVTMAGIAGVGALGVVLIAAGVLAADDKPAAPTVASAPNTAAPATAGATTAAPRAALTVNVVQPQLSGLPVRISANGNIAAWQEAIIGTETNGLRLADVKANVGDVVERGQVLATFAADTVNAEVAQNQAALAEAEALLADAVVNAQRARGLQKTGALSEVVIAQYLTAENTAKARLAAQRALATTQQLRLRQTRVLAPDAGIISARSATVGAVLPAGQELFRMIRQGRLEWRAEVPAGEMALLKPGLAVAVTPAGGAPIRGSVRMLAPTVDPQTRNGLVYVDLTEPGPARAGMFARGEFEIGGGQALTLPQSAVQQRDGFSHVFEVGADSRVREVKVTVGRRAADRIEITGGIGPGARVVAAGGGFLGDGDTVRVVQVAVPATSSTPAAATSAARPSK